MLSEQEEMLEIEPWLLECTLQDIDSVLEQKNSISLSWADWVQHWQNCSLQTQSNWLIANWGSGRRLCIFFLSVTNMATQSRVGFAIQYHFANKLNSLPKRLSDRIMTLTLGLDRNISSTLIGCYAPTMNKSVQEVRWMEMHPLMTK